MSYAPLVSIVIPTFNRARFINEALESIIRQTYTNWECIVIDDGSTDNTKTILQAYSRKDSRISYAMRPSSFPKGVNACRNYGIELSTGELIGFCDDDDFWLLDKLEKQIKIFETHSDVVFVTGNIEYVNEDGKRTGRVIQHKNNNGYIFKDILFKNRTSAITPLFKKEILSKTGLLNMQLFLFEDWEFWIRIAYYYPFYALDDVLACVRKHNSNTSRAVTNTAFEQYRTHKKIMNSIRIWGKDRFTSGDSKTIQNGENRRYEKILRNHCPGYYNKIIFISRVFFYRPLDGLRLVKIISIPLKFNKNCD